jgi:hypothetical protein
MISIQFGTAGLTDWETHIQHVGINLKVMLITLLSDMIPVLSVAKSA